MSEALQQVKSELGADAVILSARSFQRRRGILGKFRRAGVEVTAAVDAKPAATNRARTHYVDNVCDQSGDPAFRQPAYGRHRHILKSYGENIDDDRRPPVSSPGKKARSTGLPVKNDVYRRLIQQSIKKEYAFEIVSKLPRHAFQNDKDGFASNAAPLAAALKAAGIVAKPLKISAEKKRIVALVGPPGVGKTSTIAKLAAHFAVSTDSTVGCISMDNYRIAGTAQLKMYAHIIGIPVAEAVTRRQLTAALKSFRHHDVVLIDTPAINRHEDASTRRISTIMAKNPAIEVILLVDATAREEEQFDLLDRTKHLPIKRLIITKADESINMGGTVNLLIRSGLPWSYSTVGRQVMGNLKEASCHVLADSLFVRQIKADNQKVVEWRVQKKGNTVSKPHPMEGAKAGDQVTLDNSDSIDSPNCKWTLVGYG